MKRFDLRPRLKPVLLGLLLLLAVNLLFLFAVNRPRQRSAASADATTDALDTSVARADARLEALRQAAARVEEGRSELERFYREILASKEERLVKIQRELHQICETFSVQPTQIKFTHEPVKGTNLVRLTVDLPLVGGYNNLRQFIQEVEKSNIFLVMESVQLQESEQGGALLNLKVRLATYFSEEERPELRYRVKG